MDDLFDIQNLEVLQAVAERKRLDPMLHFTEFEFYQRFRFHKNIVRHLCEILSPQLRRFSISDRYLSVSDIILMALRFLATGSMQLTCGDTVQMSQSSVSRCINQGVKAILSLRLATIRFPNDLLRIKHEFHNIAGFPGVIGLVDGTHIPIYKPSGLAEPEIYRCRKGFYSINAQITCGPDYRIYNVVARWPGSTHDNRILENSSLNFRLQDGQLQGIILADGGYGNKRWVILGQLYVKTFTLLFCFVDIF